MEGDIAWPALIVGLIAALGGGAGLVALWSPFRYRASGTGASLVPVVFLALALLLLAGVLLSLWALNLRGTLGR